MDWVIHTTFLAENNLCDPWQRGNKQGEPNDHLLLCMDVILDISTGRGNSKKAWLLVWNGKEGPGRKHSIEKELRKSAQEASGVFSWIQISTRTRQNSTKLGKNFWGKKNNYRGTVSKTVPRAHSELRSIHISINQNGKPSLNNQDIQERPECSDSFEIVQVRRQWIKIFKTIKEKKIE